MLVKFFFMLIQVGFVLHRCTIMKLLVFLTLLVANMSSAQTSDIPSNDVMEPTEALVSRINSANKSLNKADLIPTANGSDCQVVRGSESFGTGFYAKSCKSNLPNDLMEKNLVLVAQYESYDKVPIEIKKQFAEPEKSLWTRAYKFYTFINEFGLTSTTLRGDDMGDTTGSKLGKGATYNNKVDVTVSLSGNLYTAREDKLKLGTDGIKSADQKFKNETIFQILADNKREGNLMYWGAKGGLVNISSKERMGLLDGSFQQKEFHEFLNKRNLGKNVEYRYIDDNKKDSNGVFIESILGLQHRLQIGCLDVLASAGLGAGISNLKQYRAGLATASLSGSYSYQGKFVEAGVKLDQRNHPGGILRTTTVFASTGEKDKYEVYFQVASPKGNLPNGTLLYNVNNMHTGSPDKGAMISVKIYNNFLN